MHALGEQGWEDTELLTSVRRVVPGPAAGLISVVQRLSLARSHADVQRELGAAARQLAGAD